jgi:hypothetical protein
LADRADPAALVGSVAQADRVGSVDLANPAALAELVALAGLADVANLSGNTDQSTEEMLPMRIKGRPTNLVVGLNNSPHAELVIGRLPELVPAAELEALDPEEEVESLLVRRVARRLVPVAELAPGHRRAQLLVVAGIL